MVVCQCGSVVWVHECLYVYVILCISACLCLCLCLLCYVDVDIIAVVWIYDSSGGVAVVLDVSWYCYLLSVRYMDTQMLPVDLQFTTLPQIP